MLAESSNGLVVCDTNPFATGIWHERYMGTRSKAVEKIAAERSYALTVVTGDEIPFVQDGLRDGEHLRHQMHQQFIDRLIETKQPFIVVTGSVKARVSQVLSALA